MINIIKLATLKSAYKCILKTPEEKGKGHSEAIYKGPLMLSTKYW